jgi:hypothetical protein
VVWVKDDDPDRVEEEMTGPIEEPRRTSDIPTREAEGEPRITASVP